MVPRKFGTALMLCWLAALLGVFVILIASPTGLAGAPEAGAVDLFRTMRLAANSLYVAALAAVLATSWAILPAYTAARSRPGPMRMLMIGLCVLPLLVPPSVITVCAIRLFGANGWLADILFPGTTAADAPRWSPVYTLTGTAVVLAWCFWPVCFLTGWSVFSRAQRSAEEAARLDTDERGVFWRITIPSASHGIAAGGAIVFLLSLTEFSVPESLRTQPVLVADVYTQFGVYFNGRGAALTAIALALIAGVALAAVQRVVFRPDWLASPTEPDTGAQGLFRPGAIPATRRGLAWLLATLPAAGIIGTLLVTANGPKGLAGALTTTWNLSREEFRFSILLCLVSAAGCAALGALTGAAVATMRRPAAARFLLVAAFLLPGPIAGMAFKLVMLLPRGSLPLGADDWLASLDGTLAPLIGAHLLRFAPLIALMVEYPLRRYPRDLTEAVRMESRGLLASWRVWGGHAIWPSVVAGTLATAALVMGEVGATILLIPPGPTTLSVRLMTLMHYAPASEVSALCLLMTVPGLVLLPLVVALFRLFLLGSRPTVS